MEEKTEIDRLERENERLRHEIADLRSAIDEIGARLNEPAEVIRAIQQGEIDALVVQEDGQEEIFSLQRFDSAYGTVVERCLPYGVWLADPDGKVLYVTPAFLNLLGTNLKELRDKGQFFFLPPETREAIEREWEQHRKSGQPWNHEYTLVLPDGSARTIWTQGLLTRTHDGLIHWVGVNLDVTEQHRIREELRQHANALRESDERFRLMVQSVQDYAIFHMDPHGIITSWNEGANRILGYSAEEVLGHFGAIVFTPEDRRQCAPERELQTAADRGQASDENWQMRKDGSRFWASGTTTAVRNEAGELQGFTKIFRDLTERRVAEQALQEKELRLRVALSAAHMGTWLWDIPNNRQTLDESLCGLFGLPSGQTVVSFDEFLKLIHADDRAAVADAFQRSADDDIPLNIAFRAVRPDGSIVWLKDQGEVFHGTDGKPLFMTGACVDITERKQAEEELRKLNAALDDRVQDQTQKLRRREKRLRALAAQLTRAEQQERKRLAALLHDHVQQFLVAAKMRAGLMQNAAADEDRSQLQVISELLDEALNATRDMVAELVPPVLHERGLGPALEWLASRMHQQHNLLARINAEPNADPEDESLRELLFHAARELLLNVIKHAHADCAWVDLEQTHGEVVLTVRDLGSGFVTRERAQDTSFGLFHLRERLSHVGGQLKIESTPGEGTEVTVRVPASLRATTDDVQPVTTAAPSKIGDEGERLRVLVVDDHEIVRDGVSGLLAMQPDMEVVGIANDGLEAIELVRKIQPNVVIMDINMPHMNGIEATRRIKVEMPQVRIIAFSLHNQADMAQAMRDAGAIAYVAKDAPSHEIVTAIRNARTG